MTRSSWVVGAVLLFASGCSFALSGPDPKQPRGEEPKCDTEKTTVLGDGLLATAAGVTALAVGANSGAAAIAPAVLGAVFVAAAIHGNNAVNECRAAKAEYIASLQAPPPPLVDNSDERTASAQRARLIRSPASATATFAVPLGPPPAATPPAPAPDSPPPPVPASATAPAPAAAPPAPPPASSAPAPTWSAFWKEVH